VKHITVKVLNSYKIDSSIQERRCQGKFSQGIFFIYTAADIKIPGSALAAKMVLQQGNFIRNGKV
jgi:hypothetical protein